MSCWTIQSEFSLILSLFIYTYIYILTHMSVFINTDNMYHLLFLISISTSLEVLRIYWQYPLQRGKISSQWKLFLFDKNILNHITIDKVFVLDRNTWNHRTVCKLFVLDRNTWNHITVKKIFALDRNTWNHITVWEIFVFNMNI